MIRISGSIMNSWSWTHGIIIHLATEIHNPNGRSYWIGL